MTTKTKPRQRPTSKGAVGKTSRTRFMEDHRNKLKRKRIHQTTKGEANEAGFSSEIIFYALTKHTTTLNVVSRATDPEQEVIGPVKKREQRGLDKNDWEF